MAIAHQLARLGVDVCEAGFPVASPGDFEAVRTIARDVGPVVSEGRTKPMVICGLARATEKDIDRCFDAVRHAPLHRVHTFLATSDIHVRRGTGGRGVSLRATACAPARPCLPAPLKTLTRPPSSPPLPQLQHKLRITRSQALERAVKAVRHAKGLCADVEFSTEDGGRSDRDYLVEVIGAVIEAGATTINVPDTVGYTLPSEYGSLFEYLIARTPGARSVVWSTHCHDDLGLAVSNSLAAVLAGARQVECTVNGIGERAGNTSLEEVVMTLTTRPHFFPVTHGIVTSQIMRSSKMVSKLTGMMVQPNKAIVGANAFAHESGIHQDGMLKNASTYEIMTPASVGVVGGTTLVLGKHSGRAAYAQRVKELGFTLDAAQLDALTEKLKALADEKKVVTDADIESLVTSDAAAPDATWALVRAHVFTGTDAKPTATVTMRRVGDGPSGGAGEVSTSALGTGPVDAVYNAIKGVVGRGNDLTGFSVRSVTDGTTALGEVTIKIQPTEGGMGTRSVKGLQRIGAGGDDSGAAAVKEWEDGDSGSGGGGSPTYSGVAAGASRTRAPLLSSQTAPLTPTSPFSPTPFGGRQGHYCGGRVCVRCGAEPPAGGGQGPKLGDGRGRGAGHLGRRRGEGSGIKKKCGIGCSPPANPPPPFTRSAAAPPSTLAPVAAAAAACSKCARSGP